MIDKQPEQLILIVDDNPQNLQFLGKLLATSGYSLCIAQNGLEALEFVKTKLPDLILLDVMMPKMNGYDVCKRLKSQQSFKHIPVIFLTARTEPDDIVKGFEVGGVDYVTKPFNSVELLARVKTHVELKMLRGFLTICSKCKNVRDDEGTWQRLETYIEAHSETLFSHGLCPACMQEMYGHLEWFQRKYGKKGSVPIPPARR